MAATAPPWKPLLLAALQANAQLKHSSFFQLATISRTGRPANRTVVFRGFQGDGDRIQINTDRRSTKIEELVDCPFAEICWYFTGSWEQFRISGRVDVVDGSDADPVKLEQREKAWFESSIKSRYQYLGPAPRLPAINEDQGTKYQLDPSAGPVDAFCLLILDPEQAEIQTERQRILLLDTSKSPVESIRSGGRYDFIVEHDVKELGPHTLVCTALYNDGDNERKYLPQFFKFVVANPLSVRTKVRSVKETTYLEACIENHTKSNLFMDQVEFEPAQDLSTTVLKADTHISEVNSRTREIYRPPVLIRAGGGIYNYLYQLKLPSDEVAQAKFEGSNILGKLQITWRTNLGEPGRLQTQQILGTPLAHKDIDLRLLEVPSAIILESPFLVHLSLSNQTDRTLGPFEVFLFQRDPTEEKAIMVNGIQKLVLPTVEAFSSTNFKLNMIATRLGIQKITGITVVDTREKKIYDPLPDVEVFVDVN